MGAYVKKKEDDEEREQSMIVHTPSSSQIGNSTYIQVVKNDPVGQKENQQNHSKF